MLSDIDVEEVFTFLSERARAPSTTAQLKAYVERIWRLLVAAIGSAFRRFHPNNRTRRIYRRMRKNHLRARDAVVSFNYDTIFEDSLSGNYPWHYAGFSEVGGLRVLKPHGSVNWEIREGRLCHVEYADAPVLVAPTHLKFVATRSTRADDDDADDDGETPVGYLDVSPEIQGVWGTMEYEMHHAKALVFIGYSFPLADLYFSSVLRSVIARRDAPPGVVLVNPDAVAIAARVQERFRVARLARYFDIEQFVASSRAEMLERVGA